MRYRPVVIPRRPAYAASIEGVLSFLLQLFGVFDALYRVFISLFGGAR